MSGWMRIEAPSAVEGDLDVERAHYILAEGLDVAIDMYSTELITSAGCQALLRLHEDAAERGCRLTVVGASRPVLEVMLVFGLGDRVELIDGPAGWPPTSYAHRN
jgi:anti-anti-sigma regulatory factor